MNTAGEISGTPTTLGSVLFTVTVTDANGCIGAQDDTLDVTCAPIALAPGTLPDIQANVPHSDSIAASGGAAPYTFAVTAGSLPTGLSLSAGGALSGTPTVAGAVSFTVTATDSVGCTGQQAYAFTVVGIPAAVADLAIARTTSGNDADGTIKLAVSFTASAFAASAEVYRAPFGGYPRYDDSGGLTPPTPSYPPGSPWVLTPVTASGQTDEPVTRDAYAYVVFLKNSFGQTSAASNKTAAAPNYSLGDVSAPALRIARADAAARAARGPEAFAVDAPQEVAAGAVFEVRLSADAHGRIQGLSGALAWDAEVCEPVSMTIGGWLESQRGLLWATGPGQFDAALLGVRAAGLSGRGTLATFVFRAKRSGDPALKLSRVLARDAANRTLGADVLALAGASLMPERTALLAPSPNPAPGASRITFDLAKPGHVELAIYSVDGRRVRTLAQGVFTAGTHGLTWDGRDDAQHRVAPGVYFARLVTSDHTQSKMLIQIQ